jgi:5-(carboxyamino)imidazole ribonucleotide synthase
MSDSRSQTLGILGGGQLGRMLVHAAQQMGLSTCVLDPDANCGAAQASNASIAAAYDDPTALDQLAQRCAAVTTEFENVPAASLQRLASAGLRVSPNANAVRLAQDRRLEKAFFADCAKQGGPGPAPHAVIETEADIANAPEACLNGVLKTAQMGYDGKGQVRVNSRAELAAAWQQLKRVPCVLEQWVDLAFECSVVLARDSHGHVVNLPLQINEHRFGILHKTWVGLKSADLKQNPALVANFVGFDASKTIANKLNYVGVLCVEFFVLRNGLVCINEIAPRPHNSGHHSLNSCTVSQFELQARAAMGWPLVEPRLHSPCIMLNLLGDLWFAQSAQATEPNWPALLALPGVHLHLYGKEEARKGRKMGHVNVTGATAAQVLQTVAQVEILLGFA